MKNNVGLIAVFTALVAFVGISTLPKGASEGGGTQESRRSAKAPLPNKKGKESDKRKASAACEEIARRLRVFIYPNNFKNIGQGSCVQDGTQLPDKVRFVIATAPSPVSTHLALLFDRAIEIIQQAAADENYAYDSSWFPWNEVSKEYPLYLDQREAEDEQEIQDRQPGVLVFRGSVQPGESPYERGLIVFVVAETPTGGIDRTEFQNALGLVQRLGGMRHGGHLSILGPTFSGSLPSLDQALEKKTLDTVGVSGISVFSGSVSSDNSYQWFLARLGDRGKIQTAMSGDSLMVNRFLNYVSNQGYGRGCVAIISEDETAFGNSPWNSKEDEGTGENQRCDLFGQNTKPIYLYYPRDIATLRSTYEQQSIFNSRKQTPDGTTSSTSLRSDLSEPENSNHDTVRSYAGQLTPLAQEAVLQNIANVLKEKAIQFIVVRSTNSLDQVFLSQFFRRTNPEARVVLDGADLLFKRGAEGSSLRGVMVLSTYPLLAPWQQDWTVSLRYPKTGSYRIFGEDVAEGLYVAARELFKPEYLNGEAKDLAPKRPETQAGGQSPNRADPLGGVPINDYGPPEWAGLKSPNENGQRPGAWLSVIGHRQFWPMAFLDSDVKNDMPAPTSLRTDMPNPADETVHPPFRFTIELIFLFAIVLIWSLCHLACCWRGSVLPNPSVFRLMYFSPLERLQHPGLIAFGSLLLAMVAIVTAAAGGFFGFDPWRQLIFGAWFVSILAICILAYVGNYKLPICSAAPSTKRFKIWQGMAGAIATGCLILFAILHLVFVSKLTPANEIPTYWRSIHLINGVSPLTPQILLIVGLYLWFWCALRGLALFGPDRPLLPADRSLPVLLQMFGRKHAADRVEIVALPVGRQYFLSLGITFSVTLIAFAMAMEGIALRTLGERSFGILMFVWFALCVSIVVADMVQLWTTWRRLLQLLRYLDRLPLRRTLASLKGLTWSSVWAMSSNVLEDRYCLISRQLESLTHLRNSIRESKEIKLKAKVDTLKAIGVCRRQGRKFANWYVQLSITGAAPKNSSPQTLDMSSLVELQEALAETAAYVLVKLLAPSWRLETDSLLFDRYRWNDESKPSDGDKESKDSSNIPPVKDKVPQYVLVAEEFVVLPYVGFIQNMLGRIRTIVLGSLCLFVAATLAASSYPFDPLPVLGGIFLTVFAIAGGAAMVVLAQMHRDSTLSHITNTAPGQLGGRFWVHLITFGIGPLLGLLTTLFPSITDFVSSWLQPSVQALQ